MTVSQLGEFLNKNAPIHAEGGSFWRIEDNRIECNIERRRGWVLFVCSASGKPTDGDLRKLDLARDNRSKKLKTEAGSEVEVTRSSTQSSSTASSSDEVKRNVTRTHRVDCHARIKVHKTDGRFNGNYYIILNENRGNRNLADVNLTRRNPINDQHGPPQDGDRAFRRKLPAEEKRVVGALVAGLGASVSAVAQLAGQHGGAGPSVIVNPNAIHRAAAQHSSFQRAELMEQACQAIRKRMPVVCAVSPEKILEFGFSGADPVARDARAHSVRLFGLGGRKIHFQILCNRPSIARQDARVQTPRCSSRQKSGKPPDARPSLAVLFNCHVQSQRIVSLIERIARVHRGRFHDFSHRAVILCSCRQL